MASEDASGETSGYWEPGMGSDASGWYAESLQSDVGASGDVSGGNWNPPKDENCSSNCEARQCGPDGCGGSCGWCSGAQSCQGGACVTVEGCEPVCAGLMIGEPDSCGGVCTGGGFGIGLKPGGAQDVGYFRYLVGKGEVPTPDLFPIEGFLNEHDTPLPQPDYTMFVTLHAFLGLFYDPAEGEPLIAMQLGLNSGINPEVIQAKHFNLVAVVDVSGSMAQADKLEFVKQGLALMVDTLDENDTLAIVTYNDIAKVKMGPTEVTAEAKPQILKVIESLQPGGSTNLYDGMVMGYEMVMKHIDDGEAIHRIMLLSDGNITAGEGNVDIVLAKSAIYNEEGIGITTIGVGMEFNFDLMYALANQGNGNFYFLDDGEKLVDVFQHEIEYLLTPVAENLKISFSLPKGFQVEAIYGFEYATDPATGEVMLTGPSKQYTVGPDKPKPPDDGDPDVAVSTLFASKKNGLLMVKIKSDKPDVFKAWKAMDFAQIKYSYDLPNELKTESAEKKVEMGSLSYFAEDDPDSGLAYFTGPIMQRNFCILRSALAIKQACTHFNAEPMDINSAVVEIADATTFCNGINLALESPDPALAEDVSFMAKLKANMCAIADCQLPL